MTQDNQTAGEWTPGPWVASQGKMHGFDLRVVAPAGDAEMGNWLIAGVRWEANAHLIAAAPAMYEALKAMLERYVQLAVSGDAGNWDPEDEADVKQARAALSQARGETK